MGQIMRISKKNGRNTFHATKISSRKMLYSYIYKRQTDDYMNEVDVFKWFEITPFELEMLPAYNSKSEKIVSGQILYNAVDIAKTFHSGWNDIGKRLQ